MKNGREDAVTRRTVKKTTRHVAALSRQRLSPITLLTDFGDADYFVAAMKGVILAANPSVRIVDITHAIPCQDIEAAAFTLFAVHGSFPAGTIHLAVVDPGVGSKRRAILIEAAGQFFVGPDNGIFSYVCEGKKVRVFHLDNEKDFRRPVSETFNGRDLFAPVAAALSNGVEPKELGHIVADYVHLPPLHAEVLTTGRVSGRIIHIDHFGNCITNITRQELTGAAIAGGVRLKINGKTVDTFRRFFAEEQLSRKAFGVWGSAGFLEIAVKNDSAAKLLQIKRGDAVVVTSAKK